jgi:hypothetical protein
MFCRFCGAHIADDSVFCAKCGKRLGVAEPNPRVANIVKTLRLKTPYPYFAMILIGFVAWALMPRHTHADYSHIKWSIEVGKKLDIPENNVYQQYMSLVLENTGSTAIRDVPVEIVAKIEPVKPAEVDVDFLARRLVIMLGGKPMPLVVILSDTIQAGAKRRYELGGSIQAEAPFRVTYEVRPEDSTTVLASTVVER